MDDEIILRNSKAWEGIDPNKEKYSKKEMARLLGVEAGRIKRIDAYPKGSEKAREQMGEAIFELGMIVIRTKE